jgi:hypothetical protein
MNAFARASIQLLERHQAAVNNSLASAQDAADRGDYADALEWIRTLEAIGEQISPGYEAKRRVWEKRLRATGHARG